MKKYSRRLMVLFAALALVLPLAAGSENETLERSMNTNVASTIGKLLSGLPKVWKAKAQARALARTLAVYPREVAVPDSDVIFGWISNLCAVPTDCCCRTSGTTCRSTATPSGDPRPGADDSLDRVALVA